MSTDPRQTVLEDPSDPSATPMAVAPSEMSGAAEMADGTPATIGGYKILRRIATGGMGAVFEAEQQNPRRTVALKVIRAGRASPENLRRFEHEAQVLGLLHHPGIAQVFEAGTADTGSGPQPFFAMELIDGRCLTVYAAQEELDLKAKLELMAKVCDAVQHAHQKGIVHRDLKPTNILVDGDGNPKVLDFGVARTTDSDLAATMQTSVGELVGTLSYMSPEQVAGDVDDIDTRSDVYALGIVLHELLTDRLPYNLSGKGITGIARIIQEDEPTLVSSANRRYRGDVDTIVGKALEKDKERRYQSVAELAADLRRHLNDEPIVARPPSTMYQLGKFARRNRALVGGVLAAIVLLVAGLIGTGYGLLRAQREGRRVSAVNEFLLQDLLTAPDPAIDGRDVLVVDVLDRAAGSVDERFADQPDLHADMLDALARSYKGLDIFEPAEDAARQALAIHLDTYGADHEATLASTYRLASTLTAQAKYDEVLALLEPALVASRGALGDHVTTSHMLMDLGHVYGRMGRFDESVELQSEGLEMRRRLLGDTHLETLHATAAYASTLYLVGRNDEAEPLLRDTFEAMFAHYQRHTTDTIDVLQAISLVHAARNELDEALGAAQEAHEASIDVYGAEHSQTLGALTGIAFILRRMERDEESLALIEQAYEGYRAVLGDDHESTMVAVHNLASSLSLLDRFDESEDLHQGNLERRRRVLGPQHPEVGRTLAAIGQLYGQRDDPEGGEPYYYEALDVLRASLPPDHPEIATTLFNLAHGLREAEKYAEAVPVLVEITEMDMARHGPAHDWVLQDQEDLIKALIGAGDHAEAERVARARLAVTDEQLTMGDAAFAESKWLVGRTLLAQRRFADAEPFLLAAFAAWGEELDLEDDDIEDTVVDLADLYRQWGRPEEAARYEAILAGQ